MEPNTNFHLKFKTVATRLSPYCHQPTGCSGGDHCLDVSLSLDDRNLLPPFQARTGLPTSVESFTERHRNPGVLRDHRLHADQPVDGAKTDAENSRNHLLVLLWHGGRRRTAAAHQPSEKTEMIITGRWCRVVSRAPCCAEFHTDRTHTGTPPTATAMQRQPRPNTTSHPRLPQPQCRTRLRMSPFVILDFFCDS